MQLKKHQQELVNLSPQQWLLNHDMGSGKTVTALALVCDQYLRGVCNDLLVVCPKSVVKKWQREYDELPYKVRSITVLSKEQFKTACKNNKPPVADAIIVDEAHNFANNKSSLSKTLQAYLKYFNPPVRYLLTATSYRRTPWNIYQLGLYLHADKRIPGRYNYMTWRRRYFIEVNMGGRKVPIVKKNIKELLNEDVALIGNTVLLSECADIPEQTYEEEYFELEKEQKDALNELLFLETTQLSKIIKAHQIVNGISIGNEYTETRRFKNKKIERILEYAENTDKLAIFCRYNEQLEMYREVLENEGYNVFVINGSIKDKEEVIAQIENAENCIALINTACAEGYELPSIGTIIYASMDWNYVNYKQSTGRFLRINRLKKNLYVHFICGGVEEKILECIKQKKDFNNAIYNLYE